MTLEELAWRIVFGAALGLGGRFFFAPNTQAHTAIIVGVIAVFGGPWLFGEFGDSASGWSIIGLAVVALVIVLVVRFVRVAADRRRRSEVERRTADVKR